MGTQPAGTFKGSCHCGIYTFHRKRAAPDHYGVNVHCFDDVDVSDVPVRRVDGKTMSVVTT